MVNSQGVISAPARRRIFFCFACACALAVAIILSLRFGTLKLSTAELWALCRHPDGVAARIILHIRLPRILLGAMVGGALAVSGAILQSVMRNVLAAPGIIGVSAGGGLAGVMVMMAFPEWSVLQLPAAFAGALLTAALVYALAWKRGISPTRLILAGVAVSAMMGAVTSAILLFNAEKAGGILEFTIGSLSARSWPQIARVRWYMAGGFAVALMLGRKLNALALGDEIAASLGIAVERTRFAALAAAALLAAASVSVAGLLGFVGLIAPHIVRMAIGADNRFLIPGSALFGAFLVVTCDTAGRLVMSPSELPVGIIMALMGPPFFLWLLRRHRYGA